VNLSDSAITWSASESQFIEPFGVSPDGLADCTFRLNSSESFEGTETRLVDGAKFWDEFRPEIRLAADLNEIGGSTGLEADDIIVSIVIRDRGLNKFAKILEWPALNLPEQPVDLSSNWSSFSRSDHTDICVFASPAETRDRGLGIARYRANVVSRQIFKLRATNQSNDFPSRWVSPQEFENRGASADTIWIINWLGEDLEKPALGTVELLLNEKFKEKFQILDSIGEAHSRLFRHEMAAAIFSEMAHRAVMGGEAGVENTGMRKMMLDQIETASGMNVEEIFARLDQPDSMGIIHAWAQDYVGLNKAIAQL